MKKLLLILSALLSINSAFGASLSIFDLEADPVVKRTTDTYTLYDGDTPPGNQGHLFPYIGYPFNTVKAPNFRLTQATQPAIITYNGQDLSILAVDGNVFLFNETIPGLIKTLYQLRNDCSVEQIEPTRMHEALLVTEQSHILNRGQMNKLNRIMFMIFAKCVPHKESGDPEYKGIRVNGINYIITREDRIVDGERRPNMLMANPQAEKGRTAGESFSLMYLILTELTHLFFSGHTTAELSEIPFYAEASSCCCTVS